MAIKDYWIYQERENAWYPWALYIVKEYDKRVSPKATCLDITYYCEVIPKANHNFSEICVHYDTVEEYVSHIAERLGGYTAIRDSDLEQLERELTNII